MWKRIKRAIRIARRNSRARRQRKRTSEILLAIFTLTNCGTLQELEYHTGYYAHFSRLSSCSATFLFISEVFIYVSEKTYTVLPILRDVL